MQMQQIVYTTAPQAVMPGAMPGKIGKRGLPLTQKPRGQLGQCYNPALATRALGGSTHLLICALDYKSGVPKCPLTCTIDGKNIYALAKASGITDIEFMTDAQCTKEAMVAALIKNAQKCRGGDTFMFFFAGHGMSSDDYDGDELDGKDENYVCDFSNTQMNPAKHFLSDDEFAKLLTTHVDKSVNIIVVSDCCHSGSMCDFNRSCWNGFNAVSISGCRDTQTSGDTGKGGICTHSLMLAIEALQKEGKQNYSMSQIYRKTVYFDDSMMNSAQDIQFDKAPGCNPNDIPWPLIPKGPFASPYKSANGLLPGADSLGPTGAAAGGFAPAPAAFAPSPVTYAPAGYPAAAPSPVTYAPASYPAAAPAPTFTQGGTTFLPPMTISAAPITMGGTTNLSASGVTMAQPAGVTYAKPVSAAPTYTYASAPMAAPTVQYASAPTTYSPTTYAPTTLAPTTMSPTTVAAKPAAQPSSTWGGFMGGII